MKRYFAFPALAALAVAYVLRALGNVDFNKRFGVDDFVLVDKTGGPGLYRGVNDTLSTVSFCLSTGTK